MSNPSKDEEFRQEAARLAMLPKADQRAVIALHRSVANDPGVSEANRTEARKRANALEMLLGLKPKKGNK
jgi:hypothetical protein